MGDFVVTQIYALVAPDGYVQGFEHVEEGDKPSTLDVTHVLLGPADAFMAPTCPDGSRIVVADGVLSVVDARPIADAKAAQWAKIKATREQLGDRPIPLRDFTLNADAGSRADVTGAILAMQLTGAVSGTVRQWRCADNVMRLLTLADLIAVGVAIAARRQALIETSARLYDAIQAAASSAEVEAVAWPAA